LLATGANLDLARAAGLNIIPGTEPRIANIVAVDADGRTSVAGIWAAGVVAGNSVHTIITAGDGARVAVNIISARNGQRYVWHDVVPPKA
jgi:thioredoxin reductase